MDQFIGRQKLLHDFSDMLTDPEGSRMIWLVGSGGVGKTRFLKEVKEKNKKQSFLRFLDTIDFDLPLNRNLYTVEYLIAKQFKKSAFKKYFESLRHVELPLREYIPPKRISYTLLNEHLIFIDNFNRAISNDNERIVICFDTIEKMYDQPEFRDFLRLCTQLDNVIVILAGRPNDHVKNAELWYEEAKHDFSTCNPYWFDIEPLEGEEFNTYLDIKQSDINAELPDEWRQKLAILTGGLPLLLDLAAELANEIKAAGYLESLDLSTLIQLSNKMALIAPEGITNISGWVRTLEATKFRDTRRLSYGKELSEFREYLDKFDQYLIATFIDRNSRFGDLPVLLALTPVLSLDVQTLVSILGKSQLDLEQQVSEAQRHVAFKGVIDNKVTRIRLQDVVRDLILQHLMQIIDPAYEYRRELIDRAIEVFTSDYTSNYRNGYDNKIDPFEQFLNEDNIRFNLQQMLVLGIELAFKARGVEEGVRQLHAYLGVAEKQGLGPMIDVWPRIHNVLDQLSSQNLNEYIKVKQRLARHHALAGDYHTASILYKDIVKHRQNFEIMFYYGSIQMGSGQASQAAETYRRAADLTSDPFQKSQAYQSCGWASRVRGQLDFAIRQYTIAFQNSIESSWYSMSRDYETDELRAARQQAKALNGLSYIHAIKGESNDAETAWKRGLALRTQHKLRDRLQSLVTAGEVYTELEDAKTALDYLAQARKEINDLTTEWRGKLLSAEGRAHWIRSTNDRHRLHALLQAENTLRQAVWYTSASDLPRALYRLANVYSATDSKRYLAVEIWHRSRAEAEAVGDIFIELNSICQLARMQVYGLQTGYNSYQDFVTVFDNYQSRYNNPTFPIIEGRFNIYLGSLALQDRESSAAYEFFDQGLKTLVIQQKQCIYSYEWQEKFLMNVVFPRCDSIKVQETFKQLLDTWKRDAIGLKAWYFLEEASKWAK